MLPASRKRAGLVRWRDSGFSSSSGGDPLGQVALCQFHGWLHRQHHMKTDGRLTRCPLKGTVGEPIFAVLCAYVFYPG